MSDMFTIEATHIKNLIEGRHLFQVSFGHIELSLGLVNLDRHLLNRRPMSERKVEVKRTMQVLNLLTDLRSRSAKAS